MPINRNNEVKEFAIGTKIEYNGKLYEVVEELFCDNCSIANICTNAEFTNIKKSDNLLSREPEVMIIIDGYVGMINPFPISKIKKI